jgi:hypothetical protein
MADPAASQTVSARLPASAQVGNHGIPAEVDDGGRLSAAVAEKAIRLLDRDGFVVLVDLLSSEEASSGLGLVRDALADPDRESATFASSTDTANRRRDFCPLPANAPVLNWVRMLTRRIAPVLSEYTGMSRSLLEI